ncbi:MAG: tRNA preQ1(34) S-adenosylmethionine ribosyltransferase-isomerase QueA [Myxococcota bacterium]
MGADATPGAIDPIDLADYDYDLPEACIAQEPPAERDGARLLHLDRSSGDLHDGRVRDLPERLVPGDLLVVNTTRVVPARLRGRKETGGAAEALLLGKADGTRRYRALLRARGRLRVGQKLHFERGDAHATAEIQALGDDGAVVLAFADATSPYALGETPLPPYIRRDAPRDADVSRYQTAFAHQPGSVAAPTAGLHLSHRLLETLEARGIERAELVLHVGVGTFRPPRPEDLAAGRLHAEPFVLGEETADAIRRTRARGGRVVAVGTTTTRVLEARARDDGTVAAGSGETDLFLRPGVRFRVVDALLTNFHLPRSSLLVLVAAFAGRERVLAAYRHAVAGGYRFYSYGDAMLVT